MRLFLVAFVLTATPVLAQSLPGQQASRLVLLAGEEGTKSLAMPPPPPQALVSEPADPFTAVYRRMAGMQIQLLEVQRVSLAGPLTVTMFGGTALTAGFSLLLLSTTAGYTAFIVGFVMMIASSLPLIIGVGWLIGNLVVNGKISREIEKVQRERRSLGNVSSRPIEPMTGPLLAVF